MVWGGRREEGSGWGTHVYFDIWQNQYNIVKFKNKIKFKKNTKVSNRKTNELLFFEKGEANKIILKFTYKKKWMKMTR